MLFSNCFNQIRLRSMLRQTEVKAFRDLLQAPSRALNSYTLFYQERFAKVKSQNSSASVPEVAKLVAQEWNSLDAAQKSIFHNKAAAGKQLYDQIRSQYEEKLTPAHELLQTLLKYNRKEISNEERAREVRATLRKFRSNFPEGPATSRGLFLKEKLAGKKIEDRAAGLALAEWKTLSPNQKAEYETKAQRGLESYKAQIRSFLSNPSSYNL